MNILHPTQVCPICPCWCFPWWSTWRQAAAEMSSRTCPQQHCWADGCFWGKQAPQLFLSPHSGFTCGAKLAVFLPCFVLLGFSNCSSTLQSINRPRGRLFLRGCIEYVHMDCTRSPGIFGVLAGELWGSSPFTQEVPEPGPCLRLELLFYPWALVPQALSFVLQEDPFGLMTLQFPAESWLPPE